MRASRGVRKAVVALALGFASYGAMALGFGKLAEWAEIHAYAHPYEPGEEAFRFLSRSFAGLPGDRRIMLVGSSTAQEGLLYERFEQAFPGHDAYQVSYGEATLNGILVGLEYLERVYGPESIPDTLVVGLDPRAIANLPRVFGRRPRIEPPGAGHREAFDDEEFAGDGEASVEDEEEFAEDEEFEEEEFAEDEEFDEEEFAEDEEFDEEEFAEDERFEDGGDVWIEDGGFDEDEGVVEGAYLFVAIDRYSPYFNVEHTEDGSVLAPKGFLESLRARIRLAIAPQQPRHRSGVVALLNHWINGPGPGMDWAYAMPEVFDVRNPIHPRSVGTFVDWLFENPAEAVRSWLAAYTAPYFHRYRISEEYVEYPQGEGGIHWWDPHSEADMVREHLGRLRDFAERHDSKLFVVVMPEHPLSADDYPEEAFAALLEFSREALGDTPLINLHSVFEIEDFVDDAHLNRQAALRATDRVIRVIENEGGLAP